MLLRHVPGSSVFVTRATPSSIVSFLRTVLESNPMKTSLAKNARSWHFSSPFWSSSGGIVGVILTNKLHKAQSESSTRSWWRWDLWKLDRNRWLPPLISPWDQYFCTTGRGLPVGQRVSRKGLSSSSCEIEKRARFVPHFCSRPPSYRLRALKWREMSQPVGFDSFSDAKYSMYETNRASYRGLGMIHPSGSDRRKLAWMQLAGEHSRMFIWLARARKWNTVAGRRYWGWLCKVTGKKQFCLTPGGWACSALQWLSGGAYFKMPRQKGKKKQDLFAGPWNFLETARWR